MRHYRLGSHTKSDMKVHLVWIPKYRKRILVGEVAARTRDILRKVAIEHEISIISGKIAPDHVHMFISYRPDMPVSKIVQYLKGISSRVLMQEFAHIKKMCWGRHFWARGYLAVSSGNITDEVVQKYIEDQEGQSIEDDSRFQIDPTYNPPTYSRW
jgi:putative transposase